jgi:hypothetical protein
VFGEMVVPGTKDNETILFNASLCDPVKGSDCSDSKEHLEVMRGGWSIGSSSKGIKAFGILRAQFDFCLDVGFGMQLIGNTQ